MNTSPISPIPAASGPIPDPTSGVTAKPAAASQTAASSSPPAPAQPATPTPIDLDPGDYRLVIEDDKAAGSYVYMTIDRRTGEVVSQLPREQILKLREAFDYTSGDVIKTTV